MSQNEIIHLCVDYGAAKVGVAVGSLVPTAPISVIYFSQRAVLLQQLVVITQQEHAAKIVVGWPADHIDETTPQTEQIRLFGEELGRLAGLLVVYYPETLTTQLAQKRMIQAGVSKLRRRKVEDSYAAAAILDMYLENL
jgi:putative Holliday junction resolvase